MLQLEFTEKRKPTVLQTRRRDPLDIFRDALSRQINAVTAALKDETVTQTKLRYIGGQRTEIQVPVQPWWWEDDGEYYLNLKYSTQTIHINGHPTIKCGDDLNTVLDTLEQIMIALVDRDDVLVDAILEARSRTCWRKHSSGSVSNHRQ